MMNITSIQVDDIEIGCKGHRLVQGETCLRGVLLPDWPWHCAVFTCEHCGFAERLTFETYQQLMEAAHG